MVLPDSASGGATVFEFEFRLDLVSRILQAIALNNME